MVSVNCNSVISTSNPNASCLPPYGSEANCSRHAPTVLTSRFARLQPRISDINQNFPSPSSSSPSGFGTVLLRSIPPKSAAPSATYLQEDASYLGVIRSRKNVAGWGCGISAVYWATVARRALSPGSCTARNFPVEEPVTQYIWLSSRLALSFSHLL